MCLEGLTHYDTSDDSLEDAHFLIETIKGNTMIL